MKVRLRRQRAADRKLLDVTCYRWSDVRSTKNNSLHSSPAASRLLSANAVQLIPTTKCQQYNDIININKAN